MGRHWPLPFASPPCRLALGLWQVREARLPPHLGGGQDPSLAEGTTVPACWNLFSLMREKSPWHCWFLALCSGSMDRNGSGPIDQLCIMTVYYYLYYNHLHNLFQTLGCPYHQIITFAPSFHGASATQHGHS